MFVEVYPELSKLMADHFYVFELFEGLSSVKIALLFHGDWAIYQELFPVLNGVVPYVIKCLFRGIDVVFYEGGVMCVMWDGYNG